LRNTSRRHAIAASFFALALGAGGASEITEPGLRAELLEMKAADQRPRADSPTERAELEQANRRNTLRLKEIVARYGWPTISMVGEDGAQAAWLLAQHSDSDRGFQRQALRSIEKLVPAGEAVPRNYAYLYDRLNTPQRYGTQGTCNSTGLWVPLEVEDEARLDERRAEAGLPPMKEYIETASRFACRK
jgi:hypothetical protein